MRAFVVFLAMWLLSAGAALAEQRFALVVGNQSYSGALTPLRNPSADAAKIGDALRRTGFDVRPLKDQNRAAILAEARALRDRLSKAGPEAVGFFYYSGHGASAVLDNRRRNYLIPVGAPVSRADDLVAEGVPLEDIVAILSAARAKAVFIVFDACRNELPWSRGGDDADKAFASVSARPGMFIAYATDQGATAPDDGFFATALAQELVKPGQAHLIAFDNAARIVAKRRSTDRLPFYSNQVDTPIVFAGSVAPPPPAPNAEALFWQSAKSCADFEAYLAQYPRGQFVGLARNRLNEAPCKPTTVAPTPATVTRPAEPQRWVNAKTAPASVRAPLVADPSSLPDFALFRECEGCPEMVVIPGGSFLMGSPAGEPGREGDEEQVSVSLGRFAVSRFPVTRGEYAAFSAATSRAVEGGCYTDRAQKGSWAPDPSGTWRDPAFAQTDRHPVVCVNWADASAFAAWTQRRTGQPYRLISEAEYEYANRAGTPTAYFWGADINRGCVFANVADATLRAAFSGRTTAACKDGYERTSPVGAFRANPWGLFDATGNVWSWTADCYEASYANNPKDGSATTTSNCARRVVRGGSWLNYPLNLRSAIRSWFIPSFRANFLGFRLARTL